MTRQVIDHFRGKYNFLSNFSLSQVIIKGDSFLTVEHAFQSLKTLDTREHERIKLADSPARAKALGKRVKLRSDWEEVKIQVMLDCLHAKFQDPALRRKLLETGDAELIEGNRWNDTFWGVCGGVGENWLGKLLMHVRWEIREGAI